MWSRFFSVVLVSGAILALSACTFKYSEEETVKYDYPELSFEDLSYTRMRDGELVARLQAENGDRYEAKHLMELSNYSFEQYDSTNNNIDAIGDGGAATVDLISNNVQMSDGVHLQVDSEDFSLRSSYLDWQDNKKILKSNDSSRVNIRRSDGTDVYGTGFYSDIRSRQWVFNTEVNGTYVLEESDSGAEGGTGATSGDTKTPAEGGSLN